MRLFAVVLSVLFVFTLFADAALAKQIKSPFKRLCLKIMGISTKTVEKEVNTVGRGIKKTTDIVVEEGKDVGKLMKGDGSKAKDVLVKPVTGATEVVGETAHGVITAPIEAGKEVYEGK